MDSFRLLLLIISMITTSEGADAAQRKCKDYDLEISNKLEGEAFYFQPYPIYKPNNISNENITWYKNNSKNISNNVEERVHYRGGALYFLNLQIEDSGLYKAQHIQPSECSNYHLRLSVFNNSRLKEVLLLPIKEGFQNIKIPCPDFIKETCSIFKGQLTWEKDSKALHGENAPQLWVSNATKSHEGIYSCVCTWEYNERKYKSSGSRRLEIDRPVVHQTTIILSPTNKEQLAVEGSELKLNCSVRCGKNAKSQCSATWLIDGSPIDQTQGYSQINVESPTEDTIATAVLTIEKVSAKDFQAKFTCKAIGSFIVNSTLTLKQRESVIPLIIGGTTVLFFCVFAALVIKYFAIDLALFFRPYVSLGRHDKDLRTYDAYVIYQMQDMDKDTEDILCKFVTKNLPSVLEEKCGYQLFIHGRDDIPGEDRLELVEDRMKQSRRLMVVLTPGSGSGSCLTSLQNSVIGGFDWQVGLHHALVQREMSVILIQLGDTGPQGYSHLPPGLQHLIQKSAPIRCPEDSRVASAYNSRFWKKVRYLMPATPAKKSLMSPIILDNYVV